MNFRFTESAGRALARPALSSSGRVTVPTATECDDAAPPDRRRGIDTEVHRAKPDEAAAAFLQFYVRSAAVIDEVHIVATG